MTADLWIGHSQPVEILLYVVGRCGLSVYHYGVVVRGSWMAKRPSCFNSADDAFDACALL